LAAGVASLWMAAIASADGGPYAPLDRPGPPLTVPTSKLQSSLNCTAGVAGDSRDPILLVPGTDLDPGPNYSWNYERALAALRWPYCTVTLPYQTTGDIQVAGEYVVYALRTMAHISGRQVDVLGYSQGGMLPRWALRFWPDTRPLVHDFVALDPSNHGTLDANAACQGQCSPADWQQAAGSHFMGALNSLAETFAGIDYTVIFSRTDEIVVPNLDSSGSSSLHTGGGTIANIAVQQICPNDVSEHLAMGSYDPVGYALAIDAFTHSGTADPSRIPPTVCAEPFQPGVDPSSFPSDYAGYLQNIGQGQQNAPQVTAEPPLQCYVFASCPSAVPRSSSHRSSRKHSSSHRGKHAAHRHKRGTTHRNRRGDGDRDGDDAR
jgi:triacylglycerol esterase/lipase EstA (alpha/beta hydrolase family)